MARVDAPSKPLAPNSISAESSRASRISVLARRRRGLGGAGVLRFIARSVPLLSTDNKERVMSIEPETTNHPHQRVSVRLLPLCKDPFQAPTDRDMLPSERRGFGTAHRTSL